MIQYGNSSVMETCNYKDFKGLQPCWGDIELIYFEAANYDDDLPDTLIYACKGHEKCYEGGEYTPAPNPTSDTNKDFEKSFPYAATLINFENVLIDYSIQCRLPKTTEKNKKAEIAAQVKVLKMYNHLLTLLQENNISPNDYYG